jgi:serine/threonine-protein kinase
MKAGETIADRYRLEARLGVGGMGEVWRATHTGTGRDFAVKFMHAHAAASASARARFLKEARVSAKINHPNVIDIFDAGEMEDGTLYLAMELLDGITLGDAFHVAPPLSVQEFLSVMLDTARALAAAHAVGVVHRDIKPANIFLHRDRATGLASAKILDFGISKFGGNDDSHATKTGAVLGSPRYMSPEQTRSAASVDHRADVWAAGVILFEGLTGTWPHEGDSFSSLVVAICTTPPTSIDLMVPDLPEPLRAVVRDCLKPLAERLPSAAELADRLATVVQDPALERLPLPRPLHPPSESIKTTTGVRVRPPLLTTTADSIRTTQSRPVVVVEAPAPPLALQSQTLPRAVLAPLAPAAALPPPVPPPPPSARGAVPGPLPPPLAPRIGAAEPTPIPASSPFAAPPGLADPRAHARTVPIQAPAILQAELARVVQPAAQPPAPPAPRAPRAVSTTQPIDHGSIPSTPLAFPPAPPPPGVAAAAVADAPAGIPLPSGDPLVGTVSHMTLTTTTAREPAATPPLAPAPPPAPAVAPRAPAADRGLRMMAAALAVLLVGIILALISVLRTSPGNAGPDAPPSAPAPARQPPAPSAEPPAPPAPSTAAEPPPPAPTTTASAAEPPPPPPPVTPGPGKPPPPRPAPPRGGNRQKLQQLGSGL